MITTYLLKELTTAVRKQYIMQLCFLTTKPVKIQI